MQRYKPAGCFALLVLALSSPVWGADPGSNLNLINEDPRVARLISKLSDADASVRTDAVQRLIGLGDAARPALRTAVLTAAPRVRVEIDRVLLHVPWVQAGDGDTPVLDQIFTGYAEQDAEVRCERIFSFWEYSDTPAPATALLRIILNDPCTAVRWEAANAIKNMLDENEAVSKEMVDLVDGTKPAPQAYLPPRLNAPLIAAAGWACRDKPARCAELLQKAREMEEENPSAFRGQMDFVYLWLVDQAYVKHQNQQMIQLLREQANRAPWTDDKIPDAISNLLATQVEYGPDAGFGEDLRVYQCYAMRPQVLYCISRLAQKQGHPIASELLGEVALLMSGLNMEQHYYAGRFLGTHRWNKAAERELLCCLHLSGGSAVNVYFELAALADERTDDLSAAKYQEAGLMKLTNSAGMTQTTRYGKRTAWSIDQAWSEVYWHYMRAARQDHDAAATKANLDKLLAGDDGATTLHNSPGMAADIIPALQDEGRNELADALFATAYIDLSAKVTAAPEEPMPKNNLAWLCACAGKRLDEAKKLADEAVRLAPDDGACLDTQAEVYNRSGDPARAVEMETKAMIAKPDDVYMARQLERFRTAAKQKH